MQIGHSQQRPLTALGNHGWVRVDRFQGPEPAVSANTAQLYDWKTRPVMYCHYLSIRPHNIMTYKGGSDVQRLRQVDIQGATLGFKIKNL